MEKLVKQRSMRPVAWGRWALVIVTAALSTVAVAQKPPHARAPKWHGDISRFHERDWHVWRSGHWNHGRHDGRLGWWWVVGSSWYFYPSPVYPNPNPWEPPPAIAVSPPEGTPPTAPPTQYWYYCDAARAYYPYVATCPGGWKPVPATPGSPSQ